MVDTVCMLASTILCLFATYRAVVIDRRGPWFRPLARPDASLPEGNAKPGKHPETTRPGGGWRARATQADVRARSIPNR